ncbi:hypothetical protein [Corynebacterium glyciniphilum]|uniref:hypothetical protein n=1 Tax=Corynebacterium glyciniphilum TaxID=1404244 RepID=UPI003DA08C59
MRIDKLTYVAVTATSLLVIALLARRSRTDPSSVPDYDDGTYNATGEYGGGPSYLGVTVTLEDSIITEVVVEPCAEDETIRGYQERFAGAVPDEVIGRSLDEADVGVLAGATVCADGFNDALTQIRDQAASQD